MEDGIIEWIDTTNAESYYLYVQMDQYYSVVAKYKSGSRSIYTVDGDKITPTDESDECNEEC